MVPPIMCTTINHVTTLASHVTVLAPVSLPKTSARNFASVAQNVRIGFQVAVVRRNVTPSSALATWPYGSVTLTYALPVGQPNTGTVKTSLARTAASREEQRSTCYSHLLTWLGGASSSKNLFRKMSSSPSTVGRSSPKMKQTAEARSMTNTCAVSCLI